MGKFIPIEVRLFAKIDKRGPDECWPWLAGTNGNGGYGKIWFEGKLQYATHIMIFLTTGNHVPLDKCVCHTCDNGNRVNPAHLWVGTLAENNQDKLIKGRHPRGENARTSKLTWEQVDMIRIDTRLQREIAADYGVRQGCISDIKLCKTWKVLQ